MHAYTPWLIGGDGSRTDGRMEAKTGQQEPLAEASTVQRTPFVQPARRTRCSHHMAARKASPDDRSDLRFPVPQGCGARTSAGLPTSAD